MRSSVPKTCVLTGAQLVHQASQTVFRLCNFIVQFTYLRVAIPITVGLYPALYAAIAPACAPPKATFNRLRYRLIPTIHSPNNKSYMDTLDIYLEKLWKGRLAT
jgi:hypothetical protein